MTRVFGTAPSIDELTAIAQAALTTIPEPLRLHLGTVVIHVQDFADDETLAAMEIESPFDLTGLYQGAGLAGEGLTGGASDVATDVERIFLYRRPILDEWCETDVPLEDLVAHVLIHEIGHHFGLSDDDMHRIEDTSP